MFKKSIGLFVNMRYSLYKSDGYYYCDYLEEVKMIYGYCRCSTNEEKQDIRRQERDLVKQGVELANIYWEYESGTRRDRVQLNRLLDKVQNGDTIIATELSRITRSTKDLIEILEIAQNKKLKLVFGGFEADCSKEKMDPMTEGMLKMMGVFAELERNMISQRVRSGMQNARAKGKVIGRPHTDVKDLPQAFIKNYDLYKIKKLNKTELARVCELSRNSINKYIRIIEENG